jgi:hypothetical protein
VEELRVIVKVWCLGVPISFGGEFRSVVKYVSLYLDSFYIIVNLKINT